uniref:Uncharacterized protein n=1 Tax=Pseudo-nitzschia australis TaxID=44445 RepID=A0A7S4AXM0_9STRA
MELEAGSSSNMHQVSYLEESVGRIVKSSKVRITWEFVSNDGREHKIVLAWSKITGNQQIRMDGTEVWFGRNHGRSVLDHNWTTRDESLKIHVLGTCAPPINENFRCYDLVINGQLFVTLPHCGQDDSTFTPVPPPIRNDNLNSIIQILYPNGYAPLSDKYQLQQQKREQQQREEKLRRKKRCGIDVVLPQRYGQC